MSRFLRQRLRRDQSGVVLVMAVPGFVLAGVSLALSVDIGRQVLEKRTDQKVADLAALDAARDLPNAASAGEASARRNGFDPAAAASALTVERGAVDSRRVFTVDPTGDAVRVVVTSSVDYIFVPGSRTVRATAVAKRPADGPRPTASAGFTIGSTLASLDTAKAPLLNAVLGRMLGGTADVVGWQGLASSRVTLRAVRDELELVDAGVQFGTVEQVLAAEVTLAQLAQATANALDASGDANAGLYAGPAGVLAQIRNTARFTLGELIEVEQGAGDAALATELNAFQLLTGSAMAANGTNTVSVPDIGVALPGVGATSLSLDVVEAQKTVIGPVGATTTTGQVRLTVTPVLDRPITVTGLEDPRLTGSFPLTLTAAEATGTLTGVVCPAPAGSITVQVHRGALSGSLSATLGVTATVAGAPAPLFSVAVTGELEATAPGPEHVEFAHPGDFTPDGDQKRVGTSPAGVAPLTSLSATATALGLEPAPADLDAVVAEEARRVLGIIDESVLAPLQASLGLSIGAVDVSASAEALEEGCASAGAAAATGAPQLVG